MSERKFLMLRTSRVSEHFDTKFIVELMSSDTIHGTAVLLKSRSFGRFKNRPVTSWSPSLRSNSRDPVNLDEARGSFHASCLLVQHGKPTLDPRESGKSN